VQEPGDQPVLLRVCLARLRPKYTHLKLFIKYSQENRWVFLSRLLALGALRAFVVAARHLTSPGGPRAACEPGRSASRSRQLEDQLGCDFFAARIVSDADQRRPGLFAGVTDAFARIVSALENIKVARPKWSPDVSVRRPCRQVDWCHRDVRTLPQTAPPHPEC